MLEWTKQCNLTRLKCPSKDLRLSLVESHEQLIEFSLQTHSSKNQVCMQTLQAFPLHWHALQEFDFEDIIMNIIKIKLHNMLPMGSF